MSTSRPMSASDPDLAGAAVADPLQTGGALTPATAPGPAGAGARHPGPVWNPWALLWDQYRRAVPGTPEIRMVPGSVTVDGRRMQYAVSDNEDACGPEGPGSPPVWAVNIHGYFAGGGMYWRESARLARALGWRVVNPSLPGFGGSDPLRWDRISLAELADQVHHVLSQLDVGPAVVLGHSMGAAVAVQLAHAHLGSTLGLILRDGVATPAWKVRHGLVPALLTPISPDVATFVDMWAAMVLDLPDLAVGRLCSTLRSMLPDLGYSLRTVGHTLPVGGVLMDVDLRPELGELAADGLPILPVWGCFDRVVGDGAAAELAQAARTPVQWVPGGHSWMLARPQGQADLLTHVQSGQAFVHAVTARWRRLHGPAAGLRPAS